MRNARLSFDLRTWPKVRHLFEGKPGRWAEGVEIKGNWTDPIIVELPPEIEVTVREILDAERVPYWVS